MIAHGLIERRARLRTARELLHPSDHPSGGSRARARTRATEDLAARPSMKVTEHDIARWHRALSRRRALLARLARERGWRYQTIRALQLGVDRGRITIPIRNAHGDLRGILRYQPMHTGRPKMLAVPGSRLGLTPHPAVEVSERILLVEGPPDIIAARSRGLPAIAVPGDHAWQPKWARLLAGRHVAIIMDADVQGRAGAKRIANDLADHAQIVDLAPRRTDGYDLTNWLLDNHPRPGGWPNSSPNGGADMHRGEISTPEEMWRLVADELAQRVAEHLAPRVAELISERSLESVRGL